MFGFAVFLGLLSTVFTAPQHALPQSNARIVGGTSTSIEKYPYQVSLQYFNSHTCGGSIISGNFVLTAAHCVLDMVSGYSVRAGSSTRGSGGTVYYTKSIHKHPKYSSRTMDYDFAILEIHGSFDLSKNTQEAVALPEQGEAFVAGTEAVVTGWGNLYEGGSSPIVLQHVTVPIVSDIDCNAAYTGAITDRMICAGLTMGGRGPCEGDHGGPLVAKDKLVGVVSWGFGCARPITPAVFSRVASVRHWIDELVFAEEDQLVATE